MAAAMLSLVVIVLCVLGVRGDCEPDVIKKIQALWGDKPPTDVLSQLVGNQTLLFLPNYYDKETLEGLKCVKTELFYNKVTTADYYIYKDPKKNSKEYYDMVGESNGVITIISGDFEDRLYVVSFNHGVLAYYQCGKGYDSYVYISVLNYDKKNLEQTASVAEATLKLTGLGKTLGQKMDPNDCPDN